MFWWRNREKTAHQDEDRLGTLSKRLDDCESKVRTLTTEWLDTLDRIERVLARLTKRAQRAEGAAAPGPDGGPPVSPVSSIAERVARRRGGSP